MDEISDRYTFTRTKDSFLAELRLFDWQLRCFSIDNPTAFYFKNRRLFGSCIACSLFD